MHNAKCTMKNAAANLLWAPSVVHVALSILHSALTPGWPARRPLPVLLFAPALRNEALTLVQPHLDPNLTIGRVRLCEAVVDISPQRLQRKLTVQIPFGARDFGAVQPPGHAHLDAARAESQRRFGRRPHGTAESHPLFELQRDRFGDQLSI